VIDNEVPSQDLPQEGLELQSNITAQKQAMYV